MRGYRDILGSSAGRLILMAGVARLAWGVEGLALLFHVEDAADSYAAAGLAVGALGLTSAAFAPVRGVLVDRRGGVALLAMSIAAAVGIAAIALTPPAGPGALSYIVLGALTGVVAPPFTAWTRSALARRLTGEALRRSYAIDNVFEEAAFVVGPLVAGLVIAVATPGAALVLAAGISALGGVALAGPLAREWAPPRVLRRRRSASASSRPIFIAYLCLAGVGIGLGLVEVAIAAFADSEGARGGAGAVLAALSGGGILGGLAYGARSWPGSADRQYALLLAALGAGLALLAAAESVAAMTVLAGLAGVAFTPVFIANSLLIGEHSPGDPSTTAFTWISTAMNAGVAAGAALGGWMVDAEGTDPPFLAAGAVVVASAALALAIGSPAARRSPDRNRSFPTS